MSRLETPADLEKLREEIIAGRNAKEKWVAVCAGTGCRAYGAETLADAFEEEIEKRGLSDRIGVRRTGCHGFCERGPLVVIQPSDACFLGAQPKNVPAIIDKAVTGEGATDKLLYLDEDSGKRLGNLDEIPFYKYQRVLLANNVRIDAANILITSRWEATRRWRKRCPA